MREGRLALEVDFFSLGTNDLTQAVYSFSREDAEKEFLPTSLRLGVLRDNPFEVLDDYYWTMFLESHKKPLCDSLVKSK